MRNEEEIATDSVAAAVEACEELKVLRFVDDCEILVLNDASTDGTAKILDDLAREEPMLRVIHQTSQRGLGGTIKHGFGEARGSLIVYTDADLPCDLVELKKSCRLLRLYGADIVSAYRHDRTGEGLRRALYSGVYNMLIRVLFGIRVRDVNFAFKLIRSDVLDGMQLTSTGVFIDAELLIRARRRGFRIIQFGVDYFPRTRGVSSLSSFPVVFETVREMLAFRLRRGREQLPDVTTRPWLVERDFDDGHAAG